MAQARTLESNVDKLIRDLAFAYQRGPAQQVKRRMQEEAPVLTGVLRQEHTVDLPVRRGNAWHVIFRAEARSKEGFPYPIAVHNGRGVVRPKRAKALRWVSRSGAVVFARRSGPSKPNPWMWRAWVRIGFSEIRRPNR